MSYSKYRAKPTVIDGVRFASRAEAARYLELRLLARAGKIKLLVLQVRFPIVINGVRICTYVADFTYDELVNGRWSPVVEDVKGYRTEAYKLKSKLMLAQYGITIRETGRTPKG